MEGTNAQPVSCEASDRQPQRAPSTVLRIMTVQMSAVTDR
jgi:hypothetical protein